MFASVTELNLKSFFCYYTLYDELQKNGLDILWNVTNAQAGVQFSDADLIGAPLRLLISARNEKRGVIEFVMRDGSLKGEVKPTEVLSLILSQRR